MPEIPDHEALIHNVEAFRAARAWAVVHRHQLPDDRMLKEYGAKIVEVAYQAGYEAGQRDMSDLAAGVGVESVEFDAEED